jgi:hypothetical protein
MTLANAGVILVPGVGRLLSGEAERITIQSVPGFTGRVKLPVKVAPAWRAKTSPGCAASIAACRFAPAETIFGVRDGGT